MTNPDMSQRLRLLQIGCGNMGGALLDAAIAQNILAEAIIIDPRAKRVDLPSRVILHADIIAIPDDFAPDILLLAVKPQMISDVAPGLLPYLKAATVVSIMAGTTINQLSALFGANTPIIRTMPNTPASVGEGMTALMANTQADEAQQRQVAQFFDAAGKTLWLTDEAQFDGYTGLAGSGPAYLFHMVEAMEQAGIAAGLSPDTARDAARQTIIGAAALLAQSTETPAVLRQNVTSPNGTTAAGLEQLMAEDDGLSALMTKTVAAATSRSKALGQDK